MAARVVYFWKKNPLIRILIPLACGIVLQWQCRLPPLDWQVLLTSCLIFCCCFFIFPFFRRYRLGWVNGISTSMLFVAVGALLAFYNDVRNDGEWFGKLNSGNAAIVVSLDEPLAEKTKSFKATASVNYLLIDSRALRVKGKVIIYFKKDSATPALDYGSRILFNKPLQEIRNPGNPGGFDYRKYCLFQGITHQVFLKKDEYIILQGREHRQINRLLFAVRTKVLEILRQNIRGDKELGLAEALLIGYKDDLDKSLVQSYSNTGVVHIIAISGLHLGLIYWLLVQLLRPLRKTRFGCWLQAILIIAGLWLFSLLAGGQPSVLRSAVMFTCIVVGQGIARKSSIYNTMAFSALILLCYDPYWLWDVGFQLSYSAVLSIIIFMKPVYNLLYIKNKLLDLIWKLNSVTIAAQILTVPLSIYHFHQFPDYFLITNFVAVPLSSLVVLGEILLCAVSIVSGFAEITGKLLSWLISMMNSYVQRIESIKYSLWRGLQINTAQAALLYVFIAGISIWLVEQKKKGLIIGLAAFACFVSIRSYSFIMASGQEKIIIYNIPGYRAIDFIRGRDCFFYGDSVLLADEFIRNLYIEPSRVSNRLFPVPAMNDLVIRDNFITYGSVKMLLADGPVAASAGGKYDLDILVISRDAGITLRGFANTFKTRQVVFESSIPYWKLKTWKKDCDSLHIPYYDVSEKGAFVMSLN